MTQPILTAALFQPLHAELIALLRGLTPDAWQRPTSAPGWRVRDVAAHLLDIDLRRISVERDGHVAPQPAGGIHSYHDLRVFIDALNAEWIVAARRISTRLLSELLDAAGVEVARLAEAADPSETATFPVAWAGHSSSPVWLDIGREYTERWHHQDQIREAVGAPPLDAPQWLRPVLEISLLALPHAYRELDAADGAAVVLDVGGRSGGAWSLARRGGAWQLRAGDDAAAACRVVVSDLVLARLLLHRLTPEQASARIEVSGDGRLATPLLRARAVMV